MRLNLNLASRPFLNLRAFLLGASSLLVLSVGLTLALTVSGYRQWKQETTLQERLGELTQERRALTEKQKLLEDSLQDPATRRVLDRARFFNQLIFEKQFSWTKLFLDLQERLPDSVRVLSVAPEMREDGSVLVEMRLGGETAEAIIQFLRTLEEDDLFSDVQLHAQSRSDGAGDSIEAEISVLYAAERAPE